MSDDEWLGTDADLSRATGPAAAHVLQAVAEVLTDAPEDRRYDVTLDVTERAATDDE